MKKALFLSLFLAFVAILPSAAQRKIKAKDYVGVWQMEVTQPNGEKVYPPYFKVIEKNGTYYTLMPPMGRLGTAPHRKFNVGTYKITGDNTVVEKFIGTDGPMAGKNLTSEIDCVISDDNRTMSVTFTDPSNHRRISERWVRIIFE